MRKIIVVKLTCETYVSINVLDGDWEPRDPITYAKFVMKDLIENRRLDKHIAIQSNVLGEELLGTEIHEE